MITKKEILRLAAERNACKEGLEWYSKRPKSALLTWEAIKDEYFWWVAFYIPEAIPYLQTLPEEIKESVLRADSYSTRLNMVYIGYRLDVLKDDSDWLVRHEVAKQGYALEQLKDDPDEWVRDTARAKLKEMQQ